MILRQQATGGAESGGDHIEERAGDSFGDFLVEPGNRDPGLAHQFSARRREGPIEELEHGALAGAVAAEEGDALAPVDRHAGTIEERRAAEGEGRVLQGKEGHWRAL